MREIIPLKKDIVFKSKIGALSNINLDHDYKIGEDVVSGTIALSGTYKMTEASVVEDDFFYTIPFSIAITDKIKKDTIKIEIDDFKYDIDNYTLKVNIDLEFSCEKEENSEIIDSTDDYIEENINNIETNNINTELNINSEIQNITNNIINTDNKYYTYKIYVVKEEDTIESICSKYNISYEELKDYNDLENINIGDKIVIPSFDE